ncbi:MAG: MoaD/ThiS family protein [Candidatus Deferrimicrobiaceae bacterium]
MIVTVRLHTILRRKTPEGIIDRVELELPDGASAASVLESLGMGLRGENLLLVVNGRIVQPEHGLVDGDEVRLIPAMSGG